MNSAIESLKYKVSTIMEEGEISLLFQQIKNDIVTQILHTKPNEIEKREELYNITQGISFLERKMTEYHNDIEEMK